MLESEAPKLINTCALSKKNNAMVTLKLRTTTTLLLNKTYFATDTQSK